MIHISITLEEMSDSFWDKYPEIRVISKFDSIYRNDKSRNKRDSSFLMWAIILYCFPYSPFYNNPDKLEKCTEILKNTDYKQEDIVLHAPEMEEVVLTEAERSFNRWGESLKERRIWLSNQKYGENMKLNEALDKMQGATYKMFKDYEEISKKLEADKQKRMSEKNSKKPASASDRGEL